MLSAMLTSKSIRDLISPSALYAQVEISIDEAYRLLTVLQDYGFKVDAFCPHCGRDTTYALRPIAPTPSRLNNITEKAKIHAIESVLPQVLSQLVFNCARIEQHHYKVSVNIDKVIAKPAAQTPSTFAQHNVAGFRIQKIGQYPSLADLEASKFSEYKRYIDQQDFIELKRASGLVSHGIGIGSFIYLRRIFERQIENAHGKAKNDPGWDESAFNDGRMSERITLLKGHLPTFIVDNAKIYGILSKHIHELTDDDCLEAYPIVEAGIMLMLDEVKSARERESRIKEASRSLQALQQKTTQRE